MICAQLTVLSSEEPSVPIIQETQSQVTSELIGITLSVVSTLGLLLSRR